MSTSNRETLLFLPVQMSVIQETMSSSVREAMLAFHHQDISPWSIADPRTPSLSLSNVATPLVLNRPLDKTLEDKILRGEYINFSLLLPDNIYRSQSPALQIRYKDSSPGSQGSPLTLVKQKKPVRLFSQVARRLHGLHAGYCCSSPKACPRARKVSTDYQQSSLKI